uniref:Galactomannan galactosyltransferase 1-like n=1 Tax=Elaeis guineensis var. tenera TaxID=51953 RepID=A0A6I9R1V4_ELAGV|nr:galactomannan galactosyltransferase 1-like [Elaeis guineensis]
MESRKESSPVRIALCSSKLSLLVERLIFVGLGAALAFLLLSFYLSSLTPILAPTPTPSTDHSIPTFYDDPSLSYTLDGGHLSDWDAKRRHWLRLHPNPSSSAKEKDERILMVSASHPSPCRNLDGDHLLLRFYKNKADYCRIHGHDLFYNTALLHPNMTGCWAKIPLIRAAMLAHPEAEWIWWIDEDAAFTDMEFRPPLSRYRAHDLVVPGWPSMVYEEKNWVGLNAGVFLIRNSQWGLDFLDAWARMGPQTPEFQAWGRTLASEIKGKTTPDADDQSALLHLLVYEKDRWADRVYLENDYDLHGYWAAVMGRLENSTEDYLAMERREPPLRRRHAEKFTRAHGEMRGRCLDREVAGDEWERRRRRRPFVAHFTGCQPCGGGHNPAYTWESCFAAIQRALDLADDQVLRAYGFGRVNGSGGYVRPLPYDFPASSVA